MLASERMTKTKAHFSIDALIISSHFPIIKLVYCCQSQACPLNMDVLDMTDLSTVHLQV